MPRKYKSPRTFKSPDTYQRFLDGTRKGGENSKDKVRHFTPESKQRQIEGSHKGIELRSQMKQATVT